MRSKLIDAMMRAACCAAAISFMTASLAAAGAPAYKNFKVTVFIPVQAVNRMGQDPAWMKSSWETISSRVHVDKVFIENYRSGETATDETLSKVKDFFVSQGVEVAGGMAMLAPGGGGQFRTLDYTDPKDRALMAKVSAQAAKHFDEFILDDLYFTNTKSESDIVAKGKRNWDDFRMQMMDEVSRELVLKPAKEANPKVHVIIKFPNFYPSFQGMGFDLEEQPKIFPEIWTGDETREPFTTDQQLQQYESYEIFRYFENIAPGRNGGGWVDPISMGYMDRYAEQLWDTILAKAPAINLFQYTDLLGPAEPGDRTAWQFRPTTFNYFEMMMKCCGFPGGANSKPVLLADAAGYALAKVDQVAGELGNPVGLAAYRPYHSTGEDFVHEVLGMAGIPIEMYPEWPNAKTVLLTEASKRDPEIVTKIEQHLRAGDNVIMTSGLLRAVQDHGMDQITDMRVTHNVMATTEYIEGFGFGGGTRLGTSEPILFPEIHFYTNEDWAVVRGLANGRGVPLLLMDRYGKGELYVLNVPMSMYDIYRLPAAVLDSVRRLLPTELPVRMEGPAKVSLFEYSNGSFVVESFLDQPTSVRVICPYEHVQNLTSGVAMNGEPMGTSGLARFFGPGAKRPPQFAYTLHVEPHSFVTLREHP